MAHKHNLIQPMAGDRVRMKRGTRVGLIAVMIVIAVLALAWFDGGEEAMRPISQEIAVPETAQ